MGCEEEKILIIQYAFNRTALIPNVLFFMNIKLEKILLTYTFSNFRYFSLLRFAFQILKHNQKISLKNQITQVSCY